MARPQTDIEAVRLRLLETVDDMVRERGSADISMTELASAAGMSPSNLYRFFENKEALMEAVAEKWFSAKIRIMEDVTASDLTARDKMLAFFARRFAVMVEQYESEPELLKSYLEIGNQYFEVVRGYVDLGDHYLALIVAEAMDQGYFAGLSIDEAVSLINQMMQCYTNPDAIIHIGTGKLNEAKLACIVDTIFVGLGKSVNSETSVKPNIKIVS
ncbi:MAG: TetR/AcrR family transcriptional regulator [Sphingorhabdus sp.]